MRLPREGERWKEKGTFEVDLKHTAIGIWIFVLKFGIVIAIISVGT